MSKLSLTPLERALASLKRSIDLTQPLLKDNNTSETLKETLRAGLIQHFEFCYELCWKTLKKKLEMETSDAELISTMLYQELIREGAQKGFIDDPEKWFEYRRLRNMTSHTYKEEIAKNVCQGTIQFYNDAKNLLFKLQER